MKNFFTVKGCPYCGISEIENIKKEEGVSFVRCRNCGLHFFYPRVDKKGQEKIWTEYGQKLDSECKINPNELQTFERRFLFGNISKKRLKVLDVGAGNGSFCRALKEIGHYAIGVEPMKNSVDVARENFVDIVNSFFDKAIYSYFDKKEFDVICFRESIYYQQDLKETFSIIKTLLKRRGLLYIKSHSVNSPYYWFNNHYERYGWSVSGMPDRFSMANLIKREGFRILRVAKWPKNNAICGGITGDIVGHLLNIIGKEDRFLILAEMLE